MKAKQKTIEEIRKDRKARIKSNEIRDKKIQKKVRELLLLLFEQKNVKQVYISIMRNKKREEFEKETWQDYFKTHGICFDRKSFEEGLKK